ncbi:hypothetical protein [Methyloprofundus sp.]|uniref:hypothetical protein n=1 Tax=Methyloprofundus sp. TaxID=2020875 RepID=UPI003D1346E9
MIDILIKAFRVFAEGFAALDWFWIAWVYLLILVNGILPIIFLPKFTAIIVLVSAIIGLFMGLVLTHALGFSKILGLMHFPWIPMVCFQLYYLNQQNYSLNSFHDYWLVSSLILSLLSLIIDFKDVYEFLLSSRKV